MILVNGKPIKAFNFPGGESHVQLDLNYDILSPKQLDILAFLYTSDDIMKLLLIVDAIRHYRSSSTIYLNIPYFPYARQDRICNIGESLSVRVMADLINNLECTSVCILDPHSEVVGALINNCIIEKQSYLVEKAELLRFCYQNHCCIVSPDAGSEKKLKELKHTLPMIYGRKIRDTKTGKIESVSVEGPMMGNNMFIIDDICDGGSTFIELAKVLKEKGANDLYLYVTHGIFSKGLEVLKPYFKKVFCYHSFKEKDPEFLEILGEKYGY